MKTQDASSGLKLAEKQQEGRPAQASLLAAADQSVRSLLGLGGGHRAVVGIAMGSRGDLQVEGPTSSSPRRHQADWVARQQGQVLRAQEKWSRYQVGGSGTRIRKQQVPISVDGDRQSPAGCQG